MIRRVIATSLAALCIAVSLQACSSQEEISPGTSNGAGVDTTLSLSVTTTTSPEENPDYVASVGEETDEEVLARVQATGVILPADLRFLLLSYESYALVLEPKVGPGYVEQEGVLSNKSFPAERLASLDSPVFYARIWSTDDEAYSVSQTVALFKNPSDAKLYSKRLLEEFKAKGIVSDEVSSPVLFASDGQASPAPRSCQAGAVASGDLVVATTLISRADCSLLLSPWAQSLSKDVVDTAIKIRQSLPNLPG
jgi:hypothetical protein